MFKQYRLRDYRFRLVFYVYAISIIGIMVIGSARKSVQSQLILGLALGTIAMLVVSLMDYTWILKFYWLIYLFNLVLLSLVQIPFVKIRPFGVLRNGAYRWLNIGGFQFQPSAQYLEDLSDHGGVVWNSGYFYCKAAGPFHYDFNYGDLSGPDLYCRLEL